MPHEPAGGAADRSDELPALTAKTDSCFSSSMPEHEGHDGVRSARVRYSKCWPQERHAYSNRGIQSFCTRTVGSGETPVPLWTRAFLHPGRIGALALTVVATLAVGCAHAPAPALAPAAPPPAADRRAPAHRRRGDDASGLLRLPARRAERVRSLSAAIRWLALPRVTPRCVWRCCSRCAKRNSDCCAEATSTAPDS